MRHILTEGAPELCQPCEPWDSQRDGDPIKLVRNMIDVAMRARGVGLAAPQVGVMRRVFVMQREPGVFIGIINPQIVNASLVEVVLKEGCLSFPDLWLPVRRPKTIHAAWTDPMGYAIAPCELTHEAARIFQHEFDHLNGRTFDRRAPAQAVALARARRKAAMN